MELRLKKVHKQALSLDPWRDKEVVFECFELGPEVVFRAPSRRVAEMEQVGWKKWVDKCRFLPAFATESLRTHYRETG